MVSTWPGARFAMSDSWEHQGSRLAEFVQALKVPGPGYQALAVRSLVDRKETRAAQPLRVVLDDADRLLGYLAMVLQAPCAIGDPRAGTRCEQPWRGAWPLY